MNWKEIPKCPPLRPIFSPKDAKEAQDIFNIYKLQKAIYTDFKRVNKSMFYRNNENELLNHQHNDSVTNISNRSAS